MEDVILEVFKLRIWRFCAFEELRVMLQEKVFPVACIFAFKQLQRIKCDEVMGRATPVRDDDKLEQIHSQPP